VGDRKASVSEPLMTCRNLVQMTSKPGSPMQSWELAWRVPAYWPGGVRHGGGASLFCGFRMELGKACDDTIATGAAVRGKASSGRNREALSTVAARAGGLARSSGEASVMGVE
jgi:hypothetical protein